MAPYIVLNSYITSTWWDSYSFKHVKKQTQRDILRVTQPATEELRFKSWFPALGRKIVYSLAICFSNRPYECLEDVGDYRTWQPRVPGNQPVSCLVCLKSLTKWFPLFGAWFSMPHSMVHGSSHKLCDGQSCFKVLTAPSTANCLRQFMQSPRGFMPL